MRDLTLTLVVLALTALVPLAWPRSESPRPRTQTSFPGWPAAFEGRPLSTVPLGPRETRLFADFPGQVARFTDGERQLVLRWLDAPSRRLHPASACFRGRGFDWQPKATALDAEGLRWGRALATRDGERLDVRELIRSADGETWSDVAAWYWAASLGKTAGPWTSILVACCAK